MAAAYSSCGLWKNRVDLPLLGPANIPVTDGAREEIVATRTGQGWLGLTVQVTLRALVNPRLALDLLRLVWSFRARGWYRRPPFLPLPPAEYIRWRMYTAYGDERALPSVEDVVRFATWRRRVMHL